MATATSSPAKKAVNAKKPKPLWWRILRWFSLASTIVSIICLLSLFYRPGWYRPASVDYQRLPDDKRAMTKLVDDVSEALNRGRSITFEITEEQMNHWLAARNELPDFAFEIPSVESIQMRFFPERIEAAAMLERGGWRFVARADLRIVVAGDNVSFRTDAVRLGALPIPAATIMSRVAQGLGGELTGGWIVGPNRFEWPNGDRECRIAGLEIAPGVLRVTLEPTGR